MNTTFDTLSIPRIWDLAPGTTFRGRTVVAVRGMVGLACSPVAVIFFQDDDEHPARFPAAYADAMQHHDELVLRARLWIRSHGLKEGDNVDLRLLRAQVLGASLVESNTQEDVQHSVPCFPG